MQCPKCQQQMEKVFTKFGIVDRCTGCAGMWFDVLEDKDMAKLAGVVDTGSKAVGKQFDHIDEIYCPVCPNSKLLRMVDPAQPHIRFESCNVCHGRFYDAGEYRDVSHLGVSDFFKRFAAKPRA